MPSLFAAGIFTIIESCSRFTNSVNRAYRAAFQAAIAALLREGIRGQSGKWPHTFVQSEFVGKLVNRRHRYPSGLRGTLAELQILRPRADYEDVTMPRADASLALRRSQEMVDLVRSRGDRQ